jgi:hypothetical protein
MEFRFSCERRSDKQLAEIVRRVLDELPRLDREIIRAIFGDAKEKDEVCQQFGIDPEYLRATVNRAKSRFRCIDEEFQQSRTRPSGTTLYSLAALICSGKTMREIVIPILADMQFEHKEAISAGRKWMALWDRVRGCHSFLQALGIDCIVKLFVRVFLRPSSR